eukprot:2422922-Pyramimonas_sp.AAC.1
MGAAGACERHRWDLRWSSLWGHETCEGCAEMKWMRRAHGNAGMWTFGGVQYGTTKREGCATVRG